MGIWDNIVNGNGGNIYNRGIYNRGGYTGYGTSFRGGSGYGYGGGNHHNHRGDGNLLENIGNAFADGLSSAAVRRAWFGGNMAVHNVAPYPQVVVSQPRVYHPRVVSQPEYYEQPRNVYYPPQHQQIVVPPHTYTQDNHHYYPRQQVVVAHPTHCQPQGYYEVDAHPPVSCERRRPVKEFFDDLFGGGRRRDRHDRHDPYKNCMAGEYPRDNVGSAAYDNSGQVIFVDPNQARLLNDGKRVNDAQVLMQLLGPNSEASQEILNALRMGRVVELNSRASVDVRDGQISVNELLKGIVIREPSSGSALQPPVVGDRVPAPSRYPDYMGNR